MAKVTLSNITKTYPNNTQAVQPATFEIKDGEFVVLVGPSGCGKSTLLRMIAGLEDVTSGELYIGDRLVNDLDPADRDIAMVFQNYALYPHMTVRKNIGYGLKNRKIPRDEIHLKVEEAASILNLKEYLERKPSQLSGGQRQRVAMGRAIVRDPSVFLFDEPLSNLDAKLRNQMRLEIKALQKRLGVTSIYVTHDQVEAMTMADRIIVLNQGKIEQIGTPAEIYAQPASTFVASFVGAPPMNLLRCKITDGRAVLNGIPLTTYGANGSDKEVIFGLRPEDVKLDPDGKHTLHVEVLEDLGAHRIAHGKFLDADFSINVPKYSHITLGPHTFSWVPSAENFFDLKTGERA